VKVVMEDNMSFDAVETQIKEAKERAEIFASSLHKAREQEELFEEERAKWVQTFEEKSIMIDQLERELTSTVDALNQEKQEKTIVQKQLVQSSRNVSNLSQSSETGNQNIEAPPLPDNSGHSKRDNYLEMEASDRRLPENIDHSKHEHDDYLERGASDRRVLELLQQSQEETTQARREIAFMRAERDQLADQVSMTKRQLERLTEDRDQLLIVKKNSDNKLQFRNEQVLCSLSQRYILQLIVEYSTILFIFLTRKLYINFDNFRLLNTKLKRRGIIEKKLNSPD
jgi:chromosome segregation ATPase